MISLSGPPLDIRIPLDVVKEQLRVAGLHEIRTFDVLPYHWFVMGERL